MFKRLLSFLLSLVLIFGSSTFVFGTNESIDILINGKDLLVKDEAYINDMGKVMLPIREIAEALNYEVKWDNESRSISVIKDSNIVQFSVDNTNVKYNKNNFTINEKPIIKDEKTYVPLELFSRAFDLTIGWDNKHKDLNINELKTSAEDFFKISDKKDIIENLSTYLKAVEKNTNFFGTVLVAKDEEVLISEGYGYSDVDQLTLNKSQTKYAIGSVTKQFVAMAIMQLNERGIVNLDDKITKYIPDFPNGDLISIHNLLIHSSGLENFSEIPEFYMAMDGLSTQMDILDLVKNKELKFKPGEQFNYSNTNYLLLGLIVEKASNMSYEAYIKENIFKPLNMNDTGFSYGNDKGIYDATAYTGHIEVMPIDDEILLSKAYGAGNMYSTVEDLYRWSQGLNTEKLVSKETLKKIFAEHIDMSGMGHYGYGWMLADIGIDKMIYHGGNTLGFTADISRLNGLDITVIILSNKGYADFTNIKSNLISIVLGQSFEIPESEEIVDMDPVIYDKLIGEYELAPGFILTVTREENKLYAQLTGQEKAEIFPLSETQFIYKIVDANIEFKKDTEGNIIGLVLEQLGLELAANKIK